jgi:DNA-binding transcriptional regulator of glucitol operon
MQDGVRGQGGREGNVTGFDPTRRLEYLGEHARPPRVVRGSPQVVAADAGGRPRQYERTENGPAFAHAYEKVWQTSSDEGVCHPPIGLVVRCDHGQVGPFERMAGTDRHDLRRGGRLGGGPGRALSAGRTDVGGGESRWRQVAGSGGSLVVDDDPSDARRRHQGEDRRAHPSRAEHRDPRLAAATHGCHAAVEGALGHRTRRHVGLEPLPLGGPQPRHDTGRGSAGVVEGARVSEKAKKPPGVCSVAAVGDRLGDECVLGAGAGQRVDDTGERRIEPGENDRVVWIKADLEGLGIPPHPMQGRFDSWPHDGASPCVLAPTADASVRSGRSLPGPYGCPQGSSTGGVRVGREARRPDDEQAANDEAVTNEEVEPDIMDDARIEAEQPAAAGAPSFRRLLTPRWIAFTIVVVLAVVAFLFLAWWQLSRFELSGSWQNFGYTLQWPFFAAFAVYLWWKLLREPASPPDPESRPVGDTATPATATPATATPATATPPTVALRSDRSRFTGSGASAVDDEATILPPLPPKRPAHSSMPHEPAQSDDDPELKAYNDYLAALHRRSQHAGGER